MPKALTKSDDYFVLRKQVEQTLLIGQRKIEEAKVQAYWRTGKLISDHILKHASRSEHYGQEVIERLSQDLNISASELWRCVKFARLFKILAAPLESLAPLTWAHYRELITIPDEDTRLSFLRRAQESGWTYRELAQKIRQEVRGRAPEAGNKDGRPSAAKLIPRKGQLYTYRLIELDPVHRNSEFAGLWVDLGFQVHEQLPDDAKGLKAGDIIESHKSQDTGHKSQDYTVEKSKAGEEGLYTYQASVERVVDGDTLLVEIDLGFKSAVRQYLRLRGIDAPELATPEGKSAKSYVERELAKAPSITITSSRSDKYDRYLADVWYGEGEQERYLNQVLLDEGLAGRWEY